MRARLGALILGVLSSTCAGLAYGNPQGPQVSYGAVGFSRPDPNTLNITNSPNAIINWRGFSVNANEITRFLQRSSNSAVLNRVIGQDPSKILGQLLSNGRVFLINPNGVVFGPDSVVDVAGLIASTLDIKDENFLAGQYEFEAGANAGGIENQGLIRAGPNGEVVLIAPSIENSGIIQTDDGTLILAAGRKVTFTSLDVGGIQFEIQAPEDQVLNIGALIARRGTVGAFAGTLRNTGRIEADSMTMDADGNIVLTAKADIRLEQSSVVTASGSNGGSISIESASGSVWIDGKVDATGVEMRGGEIKLLGERVAVLDGADVDASGETGGGKVLVGGDVQGRGEIKTASKTFVAPDARVRADAISDGDGGEVIVFADESAGIHGQLSARGGSNSGDGGFVETSARETFSITTTPDTSAPNGDGGTWLIDPNDITIVAGAGNTDINAANPFLSTADSASLGVDLVTAALTGGQNVTVTTGTGLPNTQLGNISLTVPLDIDSTAGTNTLTLSAAENIFISGSIADSQPGGQTLNVVLQSDTDDNSPSAGTFILGATIDLGPGSLTTTGDFVQLRDNAQIIVDGPTAAWTDTFGLIDIGFQTDASVTVQNGGSLVVTGNGGVRVGSDGGTGTLNVLSGGLVDIASDTFTNLDIGFDFVAGSTGFVTVDGGSRLVTRGIDNTVQVGRRGTGTLTVSGGGRIETLQFEVAGVGVGNAVITGAGSLVVASNDTGNFSGLFTNEAGFVRVGRESGSIGTLQVLNGARLEIRGTNSESAPELVLGRNLGSQGQVLVDGVGSVIDISQTAPVDAFLGGPRLTIGRRGQGDLVIQNGGEVRLTDDQSTVSVSRAGSFDSFLGADDPNPGPVTAQSTLSVFSGGKLFVDGNGGAARLVIGNETDSDGLTIVSGAGSAITLDGFNPKLDVGAIGGSVGNLQIAAGARVDVNGTTPFSGDSHRLVIARDPGSIGSVTVDGDGSELNAGRRLILGLGESATPGQFSSTPGGDGELTITGGGRVSAGTILLGGDAGTPGQVTVSGAGINPSTLEVVVINGDPDFRDRLAVGVEAGSAARLDITNGARVNGGPLIQIARWEGSIGDVVVDNAVLESTGVDTSFFDAAAAVSVGRGGTGTLALQNGGTLLIDPETLTPGDFGGLFVGGSSFVSGGERTGTVTVKDAGSRINLVNGGMQMRIGRDTGSSGTLNVINGGQVIFDNPNADVIATVAPLPGSGVINVDGAGSVLDLDGSNPGTARLFVGLDSASNPGGTATVSITAGGNLLAGNVDSAGRLQGNGTFTGNINSQGGVIAPETPTGTPTGTLTVAGNLVLDAFSEFEVELAGSAPGEFDVLDVTGNVILDGTLRVTEIGGFRTSTNDIFQVMTFGSSTGVFANVIPSFGDVIDAANISTDGTITITDSTNFIQWLVGGPSFLWTDAGNWIGGVVPTVADDVLVEPAGGTIVVDGSGAEGAGRLQMDESLTIDGDPAQLTFSITDESFVNGFLLVDNGTFAVQPGGSLTVNGTSIGGSAGSNGSVVVDGGSLTQTAGFSIGLDGSGALTVRNGGLLDAQLGMTLGQGGGSGILDVFSSADATVTNFALTIRNGTVTIDNASVATDFTTIADIAGSTGGLNIRNAGTLISTGDIVVAQQGTGSLTIESGAVVQSGRGQIGVDPGSDGTVVVRNPGSQWTQSNTFGLDLARQGQGSVTIEDGARVSNNSGMNIGRDGGNGTLTVTGAGSSLTLAGADPSGGAVFFNIGASGTGQVDVLAGGRLVVDDLNAQSFNNAVINIGGSGGSGIGGTGTLTIDGSGSELSLTGNTFGGATQVNLGRGAGSSGTLTVQNGGRLSVEDSGGSLAGVVGGRAGGTATVLVSGSGSTIETRGTDNRVLIGEDGGATLQVDSGGLIDTLHFEVGRSAAATATITGAGSKVVVSNENGLFSGGFEWEAGFVRAGRNPGSDAVLNVLNGAVIEIRPGITQNADTVGAILQIARESGSIGAVNVDGTGSLIDIFDLRQADTAGAEIAAGMHVGRGGDGSLQIVNGGEIRISAPAESFINVGRDAGAVGDVLVRGDGSRLSISGIENSVNIGRGGQGTLTIDQSASMLGAAFMNVGRDAGSNGSVTVDGTLDPGPGRATLALAGVSFDGFGAGLRVGRGGSGSLDVLGGALLSVDALSGIAPAIQLGGSFDITGGTGTATVSGAGTEVRFIGNSAEIDVGRAGTGTLNVNGGATITGAHTLGIGEAAGSNGTVNVDGAGTSIALAGRVSAQAVVTCAAIGCVLEDGRPASLVVGDLGTGGINITGGAALTIDPDNTGLIPSLGFEVTSLGAIAGNGVITGDVDSRGGLIGPGSVDGSSFTATGPTPPVPGGTVGTLDIVGNLSLDAGSRVDIELFGTPAGQFDALAITGVATLGGTLGLEEIDGFTTTTNDIFQVMTYASSIGAFGTVIPPFGDIVNLVDTGTGLSSTVTSTANFISWTGGVGDFLWTTLGNWSGGIVPTIADDVVINPAGGNIVVNGAGPEGANRLQMDEGLTIDGDPVLLTFDIADDSFINGFLTIDNGNLRILNGATLTSNSRTSIADGVGSQASVLVDGGTWSVNDIFNVGFAGTGALTIQNGGTLNTTGFVSIGDQPGADGGATVTGPASLWASSQGINVGSGGLGSLLVEQGATIRAGSLSVGSNLGGQGSAIVQDAGTTVLLDGVGGRLTVGNGGTGSLTVQAGATVDASVNPGVCADPSFCGSFVGNAAGSTGTMTITGAGSRVDTLDNFIVASAAVFTVANDGFDFGVPGGTTAGTLNILAGGVLTSEGGVVSLGPTGGSPTGSETTTATVVVDGPGSRWDVGRGFLPIANHANATADVTISSGGTLIVDRTIAVGNRGVGNLTVSGGSLVEALSLDVGRDGVGVATITDPGSRVIASNDRGGQFDPPFDNEAGFVRTGRNAGGDGTINVLNGAVIEVRETTLESGPGVQMARNRNSRGTILVDGAGSLIDISQSSPVTPFDGGPFFSIGNRGQANLTIQNGGEVRLTGDQSEVNVSTGNAADGFTGSADPDPGPVAVQSTLTIASGGRLVVDGAGGEAFVNVGRDAEGDGIVSISGAGSEISLRGVDSGGFGAFMSVGLAGTGDLTVAAGGLLSIDGDTGPFPGLGIGGVNPAFSSNPGGGTGTVSVTGAGSAVQIIGDTGFIGVGRNGSGTLNVNAGASVSGLTFMSVARTGAGSVGTLNVNGGTLALGGVASAAAAALSSNVNAGDGAFLNIGVEGTGATNVTNGGQLSIIPGAPIATFDSRPGLALGGGETVSGGLGSLTVDGPGSVVRVQGDFAFLGVAMDGTGSVDITTGGLLQLSDPGGQAAAFIGVSPGSGGSVTVDGAASELDAGQSVLIGLGLDRVTPGGTGTLALANTATVTAGTVTNAGTLSGAGTITGDVDSLGGTLLVGGSPDLFGIFNIGGNLTLDPTSVLGIELAGINPVIPEFDIINVGGTAIVGGTLDISLSGGFAPTGGENFQIINCGSCSGAFDLVNRPLGVAISTTGNPTDFSLSVIGAGFIEWVFAGSGLWTEPTNWSSSVVPTVTDRVLIDVPAGIFTVTLNIGGQSINDLLSDETLAITGGILDIAANSTTRNLVLSGGTLQSAGTLTVDDTFDWSGGTLAGTVDVTTALNISGTATKTMSGGVLNNAGAALWSDGAISAGNGSVVNNLAGATFDIQNDRSLFYSGIGAVPVFNNAGTLTKSAGAGVSVLPQFNNTGTVQAGSGTLSFTGYVQSAGVTSLEGGNISSSGALAINAGVLQGSGSITAANIDILGATIAPSLFSGRLDITGNLNLDSSSIIAIELAGTNPVIPEFGIIDVSGIAALAGTLDIVLFGGYMPTGGESFQVISCGIACNGSFDAVNQPFSVLMSTAVNPMDVTLAVQAVGIIRWISAAGGLWTDSFNWEGGALPTSTDSVLIDVPAGLFTITLDSGAQGVDDLMSDETLAITGGSLDIASDSSTRNLALSGGTLQGTGSLTVNDTFDWTGGSLAGAVDVATVLNISGASTKLLSGATAAISGAGDVNFGGGVTTIANGAAYDVAGATDIQAGATANFDVIASTQNLTVAGTLGGSGNLQAINSVTFAGGTFNSDFTIESTATADLSGSTLNGTGAIRNFGSFTVANGTVNTPFTNSGTLVVTGGPGSTFTNTFANDGTLRVEGDAVGQGIVTLNSDTSNTGVIILDSSTPSGARLALASGSLTNAVGAVIRSQGVAGGSYVIDAPLTNRGTLDIGVDTTIVNAGRTFAHETGTVDIAGGATLAVDGGTFDWIGGTLAGIAGSNLDLSTATFLLTGGGNKFIDGLTLSTSNLTVGAGSLSIVNGGLNTVGPTTVAAGATLSLTGGTLSTDSAVNIAGRFNWDDGALAGIGDLVVAGGGQLGLGGTADKTLDARDVVNTGLVQLAGNGNLMLANNATINNLAGGIFEIPSDGTIAGAAGTGIVNSGTFVKTGGPGTTNIATRLDNNGVLNVATGILSLQGDGTHGSSFNIGSGATLQFASGTHNFAGATNLSGAGTVDLAGGTWIGAGAVTNDARINITGGSISTTGIFANAGTLDAQVNGVIDVGGFTNTGLLMKSAGAGATTITAPVTSSGNVLVNSGVLDLAGGLTQTGGLTQVLAGSSLAVPGAIDLSGGTLGGTGTINASVVNSGGIVRAGTSPGRIGINGNYIQGPGGSLNVKIGGASSGPPTEFDIVDITGTASLDGTLNIFLVNGFQPNAGDRFDILNYGSIAQVESSPGSGQFVASNFAAINGLAGFSLSTIPLPFSYDVTLNPIPIPDPIGVVETIAEISAISTDFVVATINNDPIVSFFGTSGGDEVAQGDEDSGESTPAAGVLAPARQVDLDELGEAPVLMCK